MEHLFKIWMLTKKYKRKRHCSRCNQKISVRQPMSLVSGLVDRATRRDVL